MTVISSMGKNVKNEHLAEQLKSSGQKKLPADFYSAGNIFDQQQNLGLGPYLLEPGWLSLAY